MDKDITERFWKNILKRSDGHWIWQGSKTTRNYGRIMVNGRLMQATQVSYAIFHGKELDNINHLKMVKICEIKNCVNPAHLVALSKAVSQNRI